MKKVYLDTNVIMDIIDKRFKTPNLRNMVFKDYIFIISSLVIYELNSQNVEYTDLLNTLECMNKLCFHKITRIDKDIAKKFIRKTHKSDALHAAVCYNLGIPIVTRNIKDFIRLPIKIIHTNDL